MDFKFKIGDKVFYQEECYEVTKQNYFKEHWYIIKHDTKYQQVKETELKSYKPNIVDRIKTFKDAYNWCAENNFETLCMTYQEFNVNRADTKDVIAYLKLRIITCALNEGWEPTFEELEYRYYAFFDMDEDKISVDSEFSTYDYQKPASLLFKSARLAEYAATQFVDIYADFCGCKKGGEA